MKKYMAALLVALPVAANATIISWDSADANYIGERDSAVGEAACSTGDICAETQTWDLGGGLSVTASAYDFDTGDTFVWHDIRPGGGGLGSAERDELSDGSNDNNSVYETIRLTFSEEVSLDTLYFNGNHTSFSGYHWVGDYSSGGLDSILVDDTLHNGVLEIGGVSLTTIWVEMDIDFYNNSDNPIDPWYLSGAAFNTVPEPSSLLLLAAGLFGLGAARRTKK